MSLPYRKIWLPLQRVRNSLRTSKLSVIIALLIYRTLALMLADSYHGNVP